MERLQELQNNGAKFIDAKLKVGIHGHEYINYIRLYTRIQGKQYTIERTDRIHEIEWKPFIVNGDPHIFVNSYRFNIDDLLKCDDLIVASLKREDEYIRAQLAVTSSPKFQGGDLQDFRQWFYYNYFIPPSWL